MSEHVATARKPPPRTRRIVQVVVFALLLRSEEVARRFGLLAGRVATRRLRLVGRPPVAGWELATGRFRWLPPTHVGLEST